VIFLFKEKEKKEVVGKARSRSSNPKEEFRQEKSARARD
jgi:hypothetical protein